MSTIKGAAARPIGSKGGGDRFYRYKRDAVELKFIHAKGGQTEITNLESIAKQLKCRSHKLCKFMQKTLGLKISGATLPGRIESNRIESAIDKFAEEFIICKRCGLPELSAGGACLACGKASTAKERKHQDDPMPPLAPTAAKADSEQKLLLDREISGWIEKLYERKALPSSSTAAGALIDACWSCDTKTQWDALLPQIQAFLK